MVEALFNFVFIKTTITVFVEFFEYLGDLVFLGFVRKLTDHICQHRLLQCGPATEFLEIFHNIACHRFFDINFSGPF